MILLLHVLLQGYVYTSLFFRQTLDLCEVAHKGKSSISVFQEFFTSTDKIFISVDRVSTRQ